MQTADRQKMIIRLTAAALLLFAGIRFGVLPWRDDMERLTRRVDTRRQALLQVGELRDSLISLSAVSPPASARPGDFSLFSFLEKAAERTRVKAKIKRMKPLAAERSGQFVENVVELKMESLALPELVAFLTMVESPELGVAVRRMSAEKKGEDLLDVTLWVASQRQA
ncbi:MAG: hypothetical protein AB1568_06580 [Thermodesulfobacteriota bacterium]